MFSSPPGHTSTRDTILHEFHPIRTNTHVASHSVHTLSSRARTAFTLIFVWWRDRSNNLTLDKINKLWVVFRYLKRRETLYLSRHGLWLDSKSIDDTAQQTIRLTQTTIELVKGLVKHTHWLHFAQSTHPINRGKTRGFQYTLLSISTHNCNQNFNIPRALQGVHSLGPLFWTFMHICPQFTYQRRPPSSWLHFRNH